MAGTHYRRPELKPGQAWTDMIFFCCSCFATNETGSWQHTCDEHYCYNCGHGPQVRITRIGTERIRESASWVGKRYYAAEEDLERYAELEYLRRKVPPRVPDEVSYSPPERPDERGMYWVTRSYDGGRSMSVSVGLPQVAKCLEVVGEDDPLGPQHLAIAAQLGHLSLPAVRA